MHLKPLLLESPFLYIVYSDYHFIFILQKKMQYPTKTICKPKFYFKEDPK